MPRTRPTRAAYRHLASYPTRWRDNDVYGHLNNAVFYEFADTLVNDWLIGTGALVLPHGPVICVVAETGCVYHASLSYPGAVDLGLGVERAGTSSVTYRIGLFGAEEDLAAAEVRFVHVCVDGASRRPVPIPAALRRALDGLGP